MNDEAASPRLAAVPATVPDGRDDEEHVLPPGFVLAMLAPPCLALLARPSRDHLFERLYFDQEWSTFRIGAAFALSHSGVGKTLKRRGAQLRHPPPPLNDGARPKTGDDGYPLRRLRHQRRLAQWEVAAQIGVCQTALGQYERKIYVPPVAVADRLASFYGIQVAELGFTCSELLQTHLRRTRTTTVAAYAREVGIGRDTVYSWIRDGLMPKPPLYPGWWPRARRPYLLDAKAQERINELAASTNVRRGRNTTAGLLKFYLSPESEQLRARLKELTSARLEGLVGGLTRQASATGKLTVPQFAEKVGCAPETVHRWVRTGTIEAECYEDAGFVAYLLDPADIKRAKQLLKSVAGWVVQTGIYDRAGGPARRRWQGRITPIDDDARKNKGLRDALAVVPESLNRVRSLNGVVTPDRRRAIIEGLMTKYWKPAKQSMSGAGGPVLELADDGTARTLVDGGTVLTLVDGSRRPRTDPVYRLARAQIMGKLSRAYREVSAPELKTLLG